jgi:hypothetical protein
MQCINNYALCGEKDKILYLLFYIKFIIYNKTIRTYYHISI